MRRADAGESWQEFWNDHSASGALRADYFRSSRQLDDVTGLLGMTAQIKALPKFGNAFDAKLEARITNLDIPGDGNTHSSLLEGYVAAHFEHADLRVGKQIVVWGRADGINPTDNLTPHDFAVLLPFENDQRFGTAALKFDAYLSGELTLTVFTTPFFQPAKIPRSPQGGDITEIKPDRTPAASEIAIKLNKAGGDTDWSVSYFHGYSLLPSARLLGIGASGAHLELRYDAIDVLGADVAHNFGRYGFRGEAAYVSTRDHSGGDPFVKNPFLFYVAGMDRTFFENLNVNVQVFGRWVRDFSDPQSSTDPLLRGIAVQNAITDGQQDRVSYGWTSRVSQKWLNDTLEAELLVIANMTRSNAFVRPLISYAVTDHLKATLGSEFYQGADDSMFGRLKLNRGAFGELRFSF